MEQKFMTTNLEEKEHLMTTTLKKYVLKDNK